MKRSDTSVSVSERLRMALALDAEPVMEGVDMSPRGITHRVLECCEMSSACLELQARFAKTAAAE